MIARWGKVGVIGILGASLLLGCAGPSPESGDMVGDLAPISGRAIEGDPTIDRDIQIGTARLKKTVAVFDKPNGITLGTLEAGEYPLVDVKGRWAQIQLPKSADLAETVLPVGWVTTDDEVTLELAGSDGLQSDR